MSEFKARLSFYLGEVRRGETVIVYDRNTPIARVLPYSEKHEELAIDGPRRPVRDLEKVRGVAPRHPVDVVGLVRESREPR